MFFIFPLQEGKTWGPEEHRLIATVADAYLLPEVEHLIRNDFNIMTLADVATWADRIRKQRSQGSWHYANIRKGRVSYRKQRDCPTGKCVVEKVHQFERVLRDRNRPRAERKDALKYLVHFVGDVHQPLHLGDKEDRGGGTIQLFYNGRPTNLHALWDGGLASVRGRNLVHYAGFLNRRIAKDDIEEWTRSTVIDWANESRKLALEHAYGPVRRGKMRLSKEYVERAREIIDMRMSQAGVRLAHMLNLSLK